MSYMFREELLSSNKNFKSLFDKLMLSGEICEFSLLLWNYINKDKTSIKINNEPFALKDLFKLNLNAGRCKICAYELVFLFDKFGIYSEAVECVNESFRGTVGSSYGGHFYVEVVLNEKKVCIDTSLVIMGSSDSFEKLGHKIVNRYDIDTIFKKDHSMIDYYEGMVVSKL